jgi:hypothetical protein
LINVGALELVIDGAQVRARTGEGERYRYRFEVGLYAILIGCEDEEAKDERGWWQRWLHG